MVSATFLDKISCLAVESIITGLPLIMAFCAFPRRPQFFDRILTILYSMVVFTSAVMAVKGAYFQAGLLIVIAPIFIWNFRRFCHQR